VDGWWCLIIDKTNEKEMPEYKMKKKGKDIHRSAHDNKTSKRHM